MANDITTFKIIIEGSEGTKVVQGSSSNPLVEGTYEVSKVGLGEKLRKASKAAGVSIAIDIAESAAQFAVRNVGNYTGNSVLQDKVDKGVSIVSNGLRIATNPYVAIPQLMAEALFNQLEYQLASKEEANRVMRERERAGTSLYRGRR